MYDNNTQENPESRIAEVHIGETVSSDSLLYRGPVSSSVDKFIREAVAADARHKEFSINNGLLPLSVVVIIGNKPKIYDHSRDSNRKPCYLPRHNQTEQNNKGTPASLESMVIGQQELFH